MHYLLTVVIDGFCYEFVHTPEYVCRAAQKWLPHAESMSLYPLEDISIVLQRVQLEALKKE
jgi:hypothetical protein